MVNVHDDEEPKEAMYTPDGGYIPRILFFDSKQNLLDIVSDSNSRYKYFYPDPSKIAASMKKAQSGETTTTEESPKETEEGEDEEYEEYEGYEEEEEHYHEDL